MIKQGEREKINKVSERLQETEKGKGVLVRGEKAGRGVTWLWLWMADQVSRMASGEVVCVFHEVADELLGVVSRAARGLQAERNKVDVWMSVKFDLLCSLGHVTWAGAGCCNEGWAAGEWRDNGDIKVRGGTVLIKDEIHACVFDLAINHTSEGWNGLLDVHLGAIV